MLHSMLYMVCNCTIRCGAIYSLKSARPISKCSSISRA